MKHTHITKSADETKHIAKMLAKKSKAGDILLLKGNLGAGKTTFLQGFAKGLGITEQIISPTFVIMREHSAKKDNKDIVFFHVDLYRLLQEEDIRSVGVLDAMNQKENIIAIEWPEKLGSLMPEKYIAIHMESLSENERSIEIDDSKNS